MIVRELDICDHPGCLDDPTWFSAAAATVDDDATGEGPIIIDGEVLLDIAAGQWCASHRPVP